VQVRDERHADILLGFVHLACALSCHKSLNRVPVSRCSREIAELNGPASRRVYRRCLVAGRTGRQWPAAVRRHAP
jgi:hypothetical protein